MLIKPASDIRSSEITDKKLYLNRREFIRATTGTAVAAATGVLGAEALLQAAPPAPHGRKLENVKKSPLSTDEKANTWDQITTYNNYYEFGTDKDSPSMTSRQLQDRSRGRWRSTASATRRRPGTSRTSSRARRSRIGSTGTAASKRGRWSSRGSAFRWPTSSRSASRRRRRNTSSSRRSTIRSRCPACARRCCAGRTSRGCGWTRRCIR